MKNRAFLFLFLAALPVFSRAEEKEVVMEANALSYDRKASVVSAEGDVQAIRGKRILLADRVDYYQGRNIVMASGNVALMEESGNTVFADRVELKGDFRDGIINDFKMRMADNSLMAASSASREGASRIYLKKAVYSPCPLCKNDKTRPPQWQIKAEDVVVREDEQKVIYHDAFMEVYGVPVFYTPYFSHPTPDADRKSGLLTPNFANGPNLGTAIKIPYYFNIAPNMDAVFAPIFTTKESTVLTGNFRHLLPYGKYEFSGSATRSGKTDDSGAEISGTEDRWHIEGSGIFDVSDDWKLGFDGKRASDDTYLRKYGFSNDNMLTSRAYFERVKDRDYSITEAVSFQGLEQDDDPGKTPLVLPYSKTHIESRQGIIGGISGSRLLGNLRGFVIERDEGATNQRVSGDAGLLLPFIPDLWFFTGQVFEIAAMLRGDAYHAEEGGEDKIKTRLIPEISLGWSLPLVNDSAAPGTRVVLQPEVKLIASPDVDYNKNFPNEDSQDIEFSDVNLYSSSRYSGMDRVESGTRLHYGLRGGVTGRGLRLAYLVGQSYRFEGKLPSPESLGLSDNFSDLVGRVSLSVFDRANFSYRFRFDKEDLSQRKAEVNSSFNFNPVLLAVDYLSLNYDPNDLSISENRKEVSGSATFLINDEWSVSSGATRDLREKGGFVSAGGGVHYNGACVNVSANVRREFIRDRDVKPGTAIDLQIALKNLNKIK